MNKRQAKREAYKIASELIDTARGGAFLDDANLSEADQDRLYAALDELAQQLFNRSEPYAVNTDGNNSTA